MKGPFETLWFLAVHFAILSLLAFGGANTIIPEIHRQAVDVAHWTSNTEFADLFAIAQAAPGPNTLIVTLIGWYAAGLMGAVVATLAMCVPAALLTYAANRLWERFNEASWRITVQEGLMPVTVGIVAASAFILIRATVHGLPQLAVASATTLVSCTTRINPIWTLAAAAILGLSGLLGVSHG